jgi:hypothetical protein
VAGSINGNMLMELKGNDTDEEAVELTAEGKCKDTPQCVTINFPARFSEKWN